MINSFKTKELRTSNSLRILKSNAGYYVGTLEHSTGFPNSRESDYFSNIREANKELKRLKAGIPSLILVEY